MQRTDCKEGLGIRARAAKIRQHWSPRERAERMGLPPDMPARIRDHLNEYTEPAWPPIGLFQLVESRLIPLGVARSAE
jgi:hypothetical protein